jgi:poly [ADP-ribose] polymerase
VAKLPLSVSTASNKRSTGIDDDTAEAKKSKRGASKSAPIEKSAVRTITTVIGKVPVDSECVAMQGKAHVYCENNDVFDCMLNQVNKHDH